MKLNRHTFKKINIFPWNTSDELAELYLIGPSTGSNATFSYSSNALDQSLHVGFLLGEHFDARLPVLGNGGNSVSGDLRKELIGAPTG